MLANLPNSSPSEIWVVLKSTIGRGPPKKAFIRHASSSTKGLLKAGLLSRTESVVLVRVTEGVVASRVLEVVADARVALPVVDGLHHSDDFFHAGIGAYLALGDANVLSLRHIDYQTNWQASGILLAEISEPMHLSGAEGERLDSLTHYSQPRSRTH